MRILVTFAVDAEFAPWRKLRAFRKLKVSANPSSGGIDSFETQIGSHTVWVYLTGMGMKFFDFETACCFRDAGVKMVLSAGLAGSLKSELRQGEIVVPSRVAKLRELVGVSLETALTRLAENGGAHRINTLLTADHIVESAEEKRRLGQFAEAVDMESFHIAAEFIRDGITVGVVRAISDDADEDLPVCFSRCLTAEGRVKISVLSRELLAAPSKIPALVKFGRRSRDAAQKLAAFLDELIGRLTPEILAEGTSMVAAR